MGYQTIEVRKLTPVIGAEIHGVDLSKTLGNQQYEEIHQALMDNLVIFFRDQTISVDQQKDFGSRFGKLHIHPAAPKGLEQHPEILVIKADEKSKRVAGEEWHSDVSCDPEPPMGSILHLTTVPPDGGGDTMFANMYQAYETLSEPVRRMLDGLTAIHDGEHGRPTPQERPATARASLRRSPTTRLGRGRVPQRARHRSRSFPARPASTSCGSNRSP